MNEEPTKITSADEIPDELIKTYLFDTMVSTTNNRADIKKGIIKNAQLMDTITGTEERISIAYDRFTAHIEQRLQKLELKIEELLNPPNN